MTSSINPDLPVFLALNVDLYMAWNK